MVILYISVNQKIKYLYQGYERLYTAGCGYITTPTVTCPEKRACQNEHRAVLYEKNLYLTVTVPSNTVYTADFVVYVCYKAHHSTC